MSIGGGIRYADLTLAKAGNDLVLQAGGSDNVTFKDWYASSPARSISKLQIVTEATADYAPASANPLFSKKIQTFGFQSIVASFDSARAANSRLKTWAVAPALSSAHLSGSDTEALGGVLAYDFGMLEPLEHVPLSTAQDTLSDSRFGSQPQPLAVSTPIAALQPVNAAASARTFAQPDAADGVQTSSAMAPLEDSATAPSANSWEEAIARWLDQADHSILGGGQTAGSVARSATELEIAAAWRRTQQMLDVHLHRNHTGALADAEGAIVRSGTGLLSMPQAASGALGPVSDHRLSQFSGLEEGFKVLSA